MRLLFIRHGQTPDNVHGILGTAAPGPGLTALGKRQARALPRAVGNARADAIGVSTLVRTQLTAAPLATALSVEPTILDGLREVEAGALEGNRDHASVAVYLSTFIAWASGDLDRRMPDAEDGHEFFARYDAAVAAVIAHARNDEGTTVPIVSHGAAVRAWVGLRAANIGADFVRAHVLSNTGLVVVEGDFEHGWRLLDWEGEPVGGDELVDHAVTDPTGESF